MRLIYCICPVLAFLASVGPVAAQAPAPAQAAGTGPVTTPYTIFLRGFPIGREDITLRTDKAGTLIMSSGVTQGATPTMLKYVEFRYDPAGLPELFVLDGTVNNAAVALRTRFKDGSAVTEGSEQGKAVSVTQKASERPLVIAGGVFSGFAAFPPVLSKLSPGQTFPLLVVRAAEVEARLMSVTDERMQSGFTTVPVKRYEISFSDNGAATTLNVVTSVEGTLIRVSVPSQGIDVLRNDFASATSRTDVYSNPGDQSVIIPVTGFNLGATITLPKEASAAGAAGQRFPAVVLLGGTASPDREGVAPGVPAMGQLAGVLADAGFISVRYDKRGSGQSGGRAESATISDYAEDARAVMRWLSNRKDVDTRRIALVGHGEGAWMALLAASRDDRVAAVVSLSAGASNGGELFLEQQQLQLGAAKTGGDKEREAKIALQKQIQTAVMTGKGWEQLPADVKRDADTPWFQSLLAFDPAKVVGNVKSPILVMHGDLDREIPVAHAERLAALAQKGDSKSVGLVTVRGVNHVLLQAFTGEVSEYATLTERTISKDIASTIASWLTKTLPAAARGR